MTEAENHQGVSFKSFNDHRKPWRVGVATHRPLVWCLVRHEHLAWAAGRPASEQPAVLARKRVVLNAGQGDTLNLTLTGAPNTQLKLDLVDGEPLVSAEMTFTPKVLPTQSGFIGTRRPIGIIRTPFPTARASRQPTALLQVLRPAFSGISTRTIRAGRFRTLTPAASPLPCGFNGTTGGALRTYAGSTCGTSPGQPRRWSQRAVPRLGARRSVGLRGDPRCW